MTMSESVPAPVARFDFSVPTYFPDTIPWELLGTMSRKVMRKEFDWELGIHTTYLVGCCLTLAAKSNAPILQPQILSSSCPDEECTDERCKTLADNLSEVLELHNNDKNPKTVGYGAPEINPATLMTLIQLAMEIFALIRNRKN